MQVTVFASKLNCFPPFTPLASLLIHIAKNNPYYWSSCHLSTVSLTTGILVLSISGYRTAFMTKKTSVLTGKVLVEGVFYL